MRFLYALLYFIFMFFTAFCIVSISLDLRHLDLYSKAKGGDAAQFIMQSIGMKMSRAFKFQELYAQLKYDRIFGGLRRII